MIIVEAALLFVCKMCTLEIRLPRRRRRRWVPFVASAVFYDATDFSGVPPYSFFLTRSFPSPVNMWVLQREGALGSKQMHRACTAEFQCRLCSMCIMSN